MVDIVTQFHPALRAVSEPVSKDEFGSKALLGLASDMSEALSREKHGVAIAAPQIGVTKRVFVVAGHVYAHLDDVEYDQALHQDRVFCNPSIVSLSKGTKDLHEGCLSVRALKKEDIVWGYVPRAEKVRLRAHDLNGKVFEVGASGLLAQIFQHEMDHLDGILYIDKAVSLHEEPDTPPDA
jgi:peptide deformylase